MARKTFFDANKGVFHARQSAASRIAARRRIVACAAGLAAALAAPGVAGAQQQPAATVEDALHAMSDRAGVVFVGSVLSVRRVGGERGGSGAVEVAFAVEQAVRGCTAGGTYTVREWAGLWAAEDRRYRVGQRLLMLLHAPGPGGLSSPVDGADGAIPVHGVLARIGPGSTATADAASTAVADLRWVAAGHVARPIPVAVTLPTLGGVHGSPVRVSARVVGAGAGASAGAVNAMPLTEAPVAGVVGLLSVWGVSHGR